MVFVGLEYSILAITSLDLKKERKKKDIIYDANLFVLQRTLANLSLHLEAPAMPQQSLRKADNIETRADSFIDLPYISPRDV